MRGYVGVTDGDWYTFLAHRPELDEINFWTPGNRTFKALAVGEPFLFKTHARDEPSNRIVGGGFFRGFVRLRMTEAWRFFGPGNGADSLTEMHARITRYRRRSEQLEDPEIGCIILGDCTFLPPARSLPPPDDFAPAIVSGKGYPLVSGSPVEALFLATLADVPPLVSDSDIIWLPERPIHGDPRLVRPRLGQGAFQAQVLRAYGAHCAITGHTIRPTLEAAHIKPVKDGGTHRIDNGLLLRSDVHTMFDAGYLGVDPSRRLHVSGRLRAEFRNGEEFYQRAGSTILLPNAPGERPHADFLTWHMDTVFRV